MVHTPWLLAVSVLFWACGSVQARRVVILMAILLARPLLRARAVSAA